MSSVQQDIRTSKGNVDQEQKRTEVTIKNQTPIKMRLLKTHTWAGNPEVAFPEIIPPNCSKTFIYMKIDDFGSTAGVVYTGLNATLIDSAWLMAWDAPAYDSVATPNRVYVECGPRKVIDAIPWDQTLTNLQVAPDTNSDKESGTKTKVTAKFERKLGSDTIFLEATFGLM